ncbi:YraN family protein [Bacteroidaceae bacterium]|jgi:putative endonuclease|nr:YraN family protein [Bacteroides sp.]
MAEHNELGKEGEEEATNYLIEKGYAIRHRNWHCGKKELDIVAEYQNELIVVEVKTRQHTQFGNPEDAVTDRKIRRIVASTDAYLRKFALDLPVRFDIITITGKEAPFRIEHIEDAFYPPIW